jgi:hypothetical protein
MKKEFTLQKTYDVNVTIEIIKENDGYIALVYRDFDALWEEQDRYDCWIEDNEQLMTNPSHTEEEYDAIIETFKEYIIANGIKYARKCTKCGKGMNEGYVFGGGEEYYCTPECLHQVYTPKQWQEMYDYSEEYGGDIHYWTEWENEEEYILFDNELIENNF